MNPVRIILDKIYPFIEPVIIKQNSVTVSPADLFFAQTKDGVFCRPDMIVRYLFIENYFGKNRCGEYLYRKMQAARINETQEPVDRFNALIASYEKNGYNPRSSIMVNQNMAIRNGSHRGALALYYNTPLTCFVEKHNNFVEYELDWFREHGFSDEEIKLITDCTEKLYDSLNRPLNIVLFGSSADESDQVCSILSAFGTVEGCERRTLDQAECYDICCKLYRANDLYGKNNELKVTVKRPDAAFIKLRLAAPAVKGAENDEIKLLKGFYHYKLPVLSRINDMRKAVLDNTFVKDELMFIPHNFCQNEKFENIIGDMKKQI
ncbi:MAG: hypothetical protein IKB62_05915 [Oscillospiraceae bacterium]|nr:hypothetical protein [Oscillospiraceae bacterium]